MSIKASLVTTRAKEMKQKGYVYVYGYKGAKVTKDGVNTLARQYPNVFSTSIKALALKKVGKTGIDCSGYVSKATGTNFGGSTQIKNNLKDVLKVKDGSKQVMDAMVIWKQGHVALIEVDDDGNAFINEAKSTTSDLTRTPWDSRAKDFVLYGKCPGVDYNTANIKGVGKIKANVLIKNNCSLYKKRDTKGGYYRKLVDGIKVKLIKDMKNGWSKVWYNGNVGYVKNTALSYAALSKYPVETVIKKSNLRKSNNKTSKKLKTIPANTVAQVICKRKYWSNVIIDGTKGWVLTSRLEK